MRLFTLAIAVAVVASVVSATDLELGSNTEAFVCDCMPDTTNPGIGDLYLAQGQIGECFNKLLIWYDMDEIPPEATITAAEWKIYNRHFHGTESGEMVFSLVTEDWDKNTVTHNNFPSYSSEIEVVVTDWPEENSWFYFDATEFVQAWYEGTKVNYGFVGHSRNTTGECDCQYYSVDGTESYDPRLIVHFTGGTAIEGASLGETKAEFK